MKKLFSEKPVAERQKGTAGDRKAREIRMLAADRRFGAGPLEERIMACASAQLEKEIGSKFWD